MRKGAAWAIGSVGIFSQTHASVWAAARAELEGAAGSSEQLTCPIMASSGMGLILLSQQRGAGDQLRTPPAFCWALRCVMKLVTSTPRWGRAEGSPQVGVPVPAWPPHQPFQRGGWRKLPWMTFH